MAVLRMSDLIRKGVSIDDAVRARIRRWAAYEARQLGVPCSPSYWTHVRVGVWQGPGWGFRDSPCGPDLFVETCYGSVIVVDGNNLAALEARGVK